MPDGLITLDFETYSEAGYVWSSVKSYTAGGKEKAGWLPLKKNQKSGIGTVGAWCYAEHPSTEILSFDYDGHLWLPGMPPPVDLFQHIQSGGLVEAHNSFFEYVIWLFICAARYGWPPLPLDQLRCTMSRCNAWGLPGGLDVAGRILELPVLKDSAGGAIMKKVSKPRDPTQNDPRLRYTPADEPVMFQDLYAYNQTDTASEKMLSQHVPQLSAFELAVWKLDQKINARGVACDIEAVRGGRKIMAALEIEKLEELQRITKGAVETGGQLDRIHAVLNLHGVHLPDLKAETVEEYLKGQDLPALPRRILELRQFLSLASTKKLAAMENWCANDGRLHDMFKYSGAIRTQRWTSEAAQLHNLSTKGPEVKACAWCSETIEASLPTCPLCNISGLFDLTGDPPDHQVHLQRQWDIDAVEACLVDIRAGDLHRLRARWGEDAALAISGCLRGMLTSGPGCDFIGTDYDSIEARMLAVLAGEEWRIEVFRTHGKIYEMTTASISGIPFEEILAYRERTGLHHPLRKTFGKIPELASGYQGALGAWLRFGAGEYMTNDEIVENVRKWRSTSPMIVKLWYSTEDCVIRAILTPDTWQRYRLISYYYSAAHDVLYCCLPSGGHLSYHAPRLTPSDRGNYDVSYMGQHQQSHAWIRIDGYGGMFVENFTQKTAREYMAWGMLQLDAHGFDIALHVHDEPVTEVPTGTRSVEEVERVMAIRPPWAADWPITASGGWRGKRFRKD